MTMKKQARGRDKEQGQERNAMIRREKRKNITNR